MNEKSTLFAILKLIFSIILFLIATVVWLIPFPAAYKILFGSYHHVEKLVTLSKYLVGTVILVYFYSSVKFIFGKNDKEKDISFWIILGSILFFIILAD